MSGSSYPRTRLDAGSSQLNTHERGNWQPGYQHNTSYNQQSFQASVGHVSLQQQATLYQPVTTPRMTESDIFYGGVPQPRYHYQPAHRQEMYTQQAPYTNTNVRVPGVPYATTNAMVQTNIPDFSTCPQKLNHLLTSISSNHVKAQVQTLCLKATGISNNYIRTFTRQGVDVLRMKHNLSIVKCPGKVDIANLSRSVNVFKATLKVREAETTVFRSNVHEFVEKCLQEKTDSENQKTFAFIKLSSNETDITHVEAEHVQVLKDIEILTTAADDLEERVQELNRQSRKHREKGDMWALLIGAAGVGLGFLTAGATVAPAFLIAGIGAVVINSSAVECENNAKKLRVTANDKTNEAQRLQSRGNSLNNEKRELINKREALGREIGDLLRTVDALRSIEQFLFDFIRKIGYVTEILQDLDLKLHETDLENDTFKMIQQLFFEDEHMYKDIATDSLWDLKAKWAELERMLLPYYNR